MCKQLFPTATLLFRGAFTDQLLPSLSIFAVFFSTNFTKPTSLNVIRQFVTVILPQFLLAVAHYRQQTAVANGVFFKFEARMLRFDRR